MNKYYCPISNDQFNQLINFGQIFIPQCLIVEDCFDMKLVESKLVEIFIKFIHFKYDEEYLVLEVYLDFNTVDKTLPINIINVESVFTISDECYNAVTFKHPSIEFSAPIFSIQSLSIISDAFFKSDSKNGIDCLMSIFKNAFNNISQKNDDIIRAATEFRKGKKLSTLLSDSNIIDFVFLYVYQTYYPLTTLGYFYRTLEILTRKAIINKNLSYSQEILEKAEIYKLLEEIKNNNPESNLQQIIDTLEKDNRAKKFIDNLSDEDVKYFVVIPIFLKVIDEFNESNQNLEKTSLEVIIEYYSKLYNSECQQLILWLGAYLGYGNCYDYFYLKSNLKFLKNYKSIAINQKHEIISRVESEIIVEELATMQLEISSEILPETIEENDSVLNDPLVKVSKAEENSVSIVLNENHQIILTALRMKGKCSITKLVKELKKKEKNVKITTDDVINILKEIEGVKIFKVNNKDYASIEINKVKIESTQQVILFQPTVQ